MLYLLIVTHHDGNTQYYGPFPSPKRAKQYCDAIIDRHTWAIAKLVKPFAVQVTCVSRKDEHWIPQ